MLDGADFSAIPKYALDRNMFCAAILSQVVGSCDTEE